MSKSTHKLLLVTLFALLLVATLALCACGPSTCEHNYSDWEVKTNATCIADGTVGHKDCSVCNKHFDVEGNEIENLVITALGHDVQNHPAQEANCKQVGWDAYETCSRCNYTTYVEKPKTNEHIFGDWHDEVSATCIDDGTKGYKDCSVCNKHFDVEGNEIDNLVITALGHDVQNHSAQEANCKQVGWDAYETCSRCDYTTYVEKPKTNEHVFGEWHDEVSVTCIDDGTKGYKDCSVCNKHFDVEGNEIENIVIAALGHDVQNHSAQEANCKQVGWDAYETCSRCDYTTYVEIPTQAHTLAFVEAKGSTCAEFGNVEHWHCSICKKNFGDEMGENELENVTIPKEAHNYVEGFCEQCGAQEPSKGLEYTLSSDGTYYSVSGVGSWKYAKLLIIPSSYNNLPVKEIGSGAFSSRSLGSVKFEENSQVTLIRSNAFSYSTIENITIPASVTEIGAGAFTGCECLLKVEFEENSQLATIGADAFRKCGNLKVEIPSSVTSIGDAAFRECAVLTSIYIPSGVTSIGRSLSMLVAVSKA